MARKSNCSNGPNLLELSSDGLPKSNRSENGKGASHEDQDRCSRRARNLDSRGNPTLSVTLTLDDGHYVSASVPSVRPPESSKRGNCETGEPGGSAGKGVRRAISNIRDHLLPKLVGLDPTQQANIDGMMARLDERAIFPDWRERRVGSVDWPSREPEPRRRSCRLYKYLGGESASRLPVPMMNVINGGVHASNALEFQEFMIVLTALRPLRKQYAGVLKSIIALGLSCMKGAAYLRRRRRRLCAGVGERRRSLRAHRESHCTCGVCPGAQVAIALDPAASSFWDDGAYQLYGNRTSTQVLIDLYRDWRKPVSHHIHRGRFGRTRLGRLCCDEPPVRRSNTNCR